jgi:hypothetical protein
MSPKPPERWPSQSTSFPRSFYDDWAVFCRQALSTMLRGSVGGSPAEVLLAGGAILGVAGMLALISANRETLDQKGKDWGIEDLAKLTGIGGAVLGAAVGGLGIAWLTRTLGRHADTAKVDALQTRLSTVRREFEALRQDRHKGRLDPQKHQLAVERLFYELTRERKRS